MKRCLLLPVLLVSGGLPAQVDLYRDPGMQKVVQVAIVCKDIETTSKRWAHLLGVPAPKVSLTRPGHEVKMTYRGKPSDGRVKLAFLRLGQVSLEFLEPVGENTSWKHGLDQYGEGVHHLGFQVEDIERAAQTFERLGMREEHRGRYDKDNGTYVYFDSRSALGVTIELLHSDR